MEECTEEALRRAKLLTIHKDNYGAYIQDPESGIEVGLWISDWNGDLVIQVDTSLNTGTFRINVNEEPIWDQDAEGD